MSRWRPRTLAIASAAVLAPVALVLAISFAVTPEDIESGRVVLSPTCTFKQLSGHECPSCGMTRGFSAMSHGRSGDAYRYNRASPALYLLCWIAVAMAAAGLTRAGVEAWGRRIRVAATNPNPLEREPERVCR